MHRLPRRSCLLAAVIGCLLAPATAPAAATVATTVGAVDCARGGAVVTLANVARTPVKFTVTRGSDVVISTTLASTLTPVTRIVPIAEGATETVTVRHGSSYVSARVDGTCAGNGQREAIRQPGAPAPVRTVGAAPSGDVALEDARSISPLAAGLAALLAAVTIAGGVVWIRNQRRRAAPTPAPAARPPA